MSEYRVTDKRATSPTGITAYQRSEKNEYGMNMSLGTRFQAMVRAETPEEAAVVGASLLGIPVSMVEVEDYMDPGTTLVLDPALQRKIEEAGLGEITDSGV